MNRLHPALDPIAEAIGRLHRAGWSVGDHLAVSGSGATWVVTGRNGENLLTVEGATAAEAWGRAPEEAARLSLLGRAGDDNATD